MPSSSPFIAVVALASFFATAGCNNLYPKSAKSDVEYFAVKYRVRAENEPSRVYEVKQADKFPGLRGTWNNAVLHAPERCSNDSANKGTGVGKGTGRKLETACGFWLSELERGLVQSKFTVASWTALRDLERTKQVPSYVAARDLGADVVFVVNSLEIEDVKLGETAHVSFDVYEADEDGRATHKQALPSELFSQVRAFVNRRTKPVRKQFEDEITHVTATLDVSAVDTKTGEAVWFYRKQEVKPISMKLDRYFLFAHDEKSFWPVQPQHFALSEKEQATAAKSSDDSRDHETFWLDYKAPPESAFDEQGFALGRAVLADFLQRFRGG